MASKTTKATKTTKTTKLAKLKKAAPPAKRAKAAAHALQAIPRASSESAPKPAPGLGPKDIKAGMTKTMTASMQLQLYYNVITKQPDIILPAQIDADTKSKVTRQLPEHQKVARENAQDWFTRINPKMVATLSDIVAYDNQWEVFRKRLLSLADNIDRPENKRSFVDGMKILRQSVLGKAEAVKPLIDDMNGFLPRIQEDYRNIQGDSDKVKVWMSGQNGYLEQAQNEIDAMQSATRRDLAIIAGGACAAVGGIALIAVGAFTTVVTGGAAAAMIAGGVVVLAGGAAAIGVATRDYIEKSRALTDKLRNLTSAQLVYNAVKNADGNLQEMLGALQGGISAVQELHKGWNQLHGNFDATIRALDEATPDLGSWVTEQIEAASADWKGTRQLAMHLQSNGTIPVLEGGPPHELVAKQLAAA